MKRKYLMMPLFISGPKQPGNDIDVYLAPLIEDLDRLWKDGMKVFDAHSRSNFTLRTIIFCTINDFPAYGNLSGYRKKGENACPICMEETHSIWLSNCRKTVYLGHRRFLSHHHPYRRPNYKIKFDGNTEIRQAPISKSGRQTYEHVNAYDYCFQAVFGINFTYSKYDWCLCLHKSQRDYLINF